MSAFKTVLSAAAVMLSVSVAQAATITPIAADCDPNLADDLGTASACGTSVDRTDATAVNLGASDGNFFSLGLGGSALFGISPSFTGDVSVIEITFGGASSSHDEAAEVAVRLLDGTFTVLGIANNQAGMANANTSTFAFSGVADAIRLVDISRATFPNTRSGDGFDLDALSVAPIPLPASALLLLAGVGGLGVAARRRKG